MRAVLLHGWGLKRSIWKEASESLAVFDKVSSPCLYEIAREINSPQFELMASALKGSIEPNTIIIAWSMGGLIALPLQKLTNNVKSIIFIASSPCFVNKEGWLNAIDKNDINSLQISLKENTNKTLEHFSGLVSYGDINPKQTNKIIRNHLANDNDKETLHSWLDQMRLKDIRKNYSGITCPALTILGENDSLIKVAIEKDLKLLNQNIDVQVVKDCGHAPFLSKQENISTLIKGFINAKLG